MIQSEKLFLKFDCSPFNTIKIRTIVRTMTVPSVSYHAVFPGILTRLNPSVLVDCLVAFKVFQPLSGYLIPKSAEG